MLRYMYTASDWLATASAILSPIIIVHWLLQGMGIPAFQPLIDFFQPFISPLNAIGNMVLAPLPTINVPLYGPFHPGGDIRVMGNEIKAIQPFVALFFTFLFFAFNFASVMMRAGEKKVNITMETAKHKRRLLELQVARQAEKVRFNTNQHLLAYVAYNFQANPAGGNIFEALYAKYNGRAVEITPETMVVHFQNLDNALKYVQEAVQGVFRHYATLRPMDPQPPFRIGVLSFEAGEDPVNALPVGRELIRYAGDNQIIFSEDVKKFIDATGKSGAYRSQSIGLYSFSNRKSMEVYRLMIG